jgi:hypothetical protein
MDTLRWTVGLSVSLIFGGIVTQFYARKVRDLVSTDDPQYRLLIPTCLGIVENLFFSIGVAFEVSGAMTAMVIWMGAKMAAHWGRDAEVGHVHKVATVRFFVLSGTMVSLLFAMIGGLICAGRLKF